MKAASRPGFDAQWRRLVVVEVHHEHPEQGDAAKDVEHGDSVERRARSVSGQPESRAPAGRHCELLAVHRSAWMRAWEVSANA